MRGHIHIWGFLGGPQNEDYSILGSMLGPPYIGNLPYTYSCTGKVHLQILFVLGIGWKHTRVHGHKGIVALKPSLKNQRHGF